MTKSLRSSAASGTINASRLFVRYAPPKRATAAIDAKLGGCGIKREAAAARMIKASTTNRGFDMLISSKSGILFFLPRNSELYHPGNKSQNQKPSLKTVSPTENSTALLKFGPA